MNTKTVMSSKGQIVIPKGIRERMGLHSGSELIIHLREDNILEFKPVYKNLKDFFGKGATKLHHITNVIDIDAAITEAVMENMNSSK